MSCCDIFDKFGAARGELFETDRWRVVVRPKQVTAGALVLIAKRHAIGLSDLAPQEAADLPIACARLEAGLRAAFRPDKINYLALMMVDPHLHFHVVPRYATERRVEGWSFRDQAWGGPPRLDVECPDAAVVASIVSTLRQA